MRGPESGQGRSPDCSSHQLFEMMVLWCGVDALSAAGLCDVAALEVALEAGSYDREWFCYSDCVLHTI